MTVAVGPDWGHRHPCKSWFDVRELEPGVHLIGEPGHVNSFLVEGTESAVLIDTGLGVGNIRAVVNELTEKPLQVVNSHYHFDHTGGNQFFDDIAIHSAGADLLQQSAPAGMAEAYMEYVQRLLDAWGPYKEADDVYFHLLTRERLIRPLPEGFDPAGYQIVRSRPTTLLEAGDVLDLGGRELEVLHTPGHSPDSICLLDEENGLLFGGDTINTGPIYAHLPNSDVREFANSARSLVELSSSLRRVFVCHFLRIDNTPAILKEIADGFDRLLERDVQFRDNVDWRNDPVREACFDHFSIFVRE